FMKFFLRITQAQAIHIKLFSFSHSLDIRKTVDSLCSVDHFPVPNVNNYQQYDGRHKEIQNKLLNLTQYQDLIKTIIEQLTNFIQEHIKTCITLAIGCEQGRHRSVATVNNKK
ncbi:unnamed protein product, partial [Rotaria sp. Silwood1]